MNYDHMRGRHETSFDSIDILEAWSVQTLFHRDQALPILWGCFCKTDIGPSQLPTHKFNTQVLSQFFIALLNQMSCTSLLHCNNPLRW